MKGKDAAVIKVLSDIGMTDEPELTPAQEEHLKRALDPEEQYLYDVERLFNPQLTENWSGEDGIREEPNPLPIVDARMLSSVGSNTDYIIQKANEIGDGDMQQGMEKLGSVESIPVSKIIGTEDMLDGEHLEGLIQGTRQADSTAMAIKMRDNYYLIDGNHQAAAALKRGDKNLEVFVFDISNI